MALDGINQEDLDVILRLQRDDFQRLATSKRRRDGRMAHDYDVAMGHWADELDEFEDEAPAGKRFREIWSGDGVDSVDDTSDETSSSDGEQGMNGGSPSFGAESPLLVSDFDTFAMPDATHEIMPSPMLSSVTSLSSVQCEAELQVEDTMSGIGFDTPEHVQDESGSSLFTSSESSEDSSEDSSENRSVIHEATIHKFEPVPDVGEGKSCIVCDEKIPLLERVECPCAHIYCFPCLSNFVKVSMSDETRFPPRCCGQVIPRRTIKDALPSDVWQQYMSKTAEFGTVIRLYCHDCKTFIPSTRIQDKVGQCATCKSKTCVYCQKKEHEHECPKDNATAGFLRFASKQEWQRCPSCRTMIERTEGCNHMSCNCGTDFCYGCGALWGSCIDCADQETSEDEEDRTSASDDVGHEQDMDEMLPHPSAFLTGPLQDLTVNQDDGSAASSTTESIPVIEIKDEDSDDNMNLRDKYPESSDGSSCPPRTRWR